MRDLVQRMWDRSFQPRLRGLGLDVRRFPPAPEANWRDKALDELLAERLGPGAAALAEAFDFLRFCAAHAAESHAQVFQDLFVRHRLGDKRGGFFVEFGATDGIALSNTKSLEERFGWQGIVAEPARCWHERLRRNRRCAVDERCVWTTTGERLRFKEVSNPDLSTIERYSEQDHHAAWRQAGSVYEVETVSLDDLLATHGAPAEIDFLSIDTEGSELAILERFDFSRHRVAVISVEHNYSAEREKLFALLSAKGYVRRLVEFSKQDDWYVLPD